MLRKKQRMHKSYAWNRYELLYSILNFLFGISNIFFPCFEKNRLENSESRASLARQGIKGKNFMA